MAASELAVTTGMLDSAVIDTVTGEIVDRNELAERLLGQADRDRRGAGLRQRLVIPPASGG